MIKRTEIIYSTYSSEDIKRKVAGELSSEPKLRFNLLKYSKEFDDYLNDNKKFTGVISDTSILLNSKSTFLWPRTKIDIEEGEKTKLTLTYKMYWLYVLVYFFLMVVFILGLIDSESFTVSDALVLILIFGGIALFGRWLQKNIKNFLAD